MLCSLTSAHSSRTSQTDLQIKFHGVDPLSLLRSLQKEDRWPDFTPPADELFRRFRGRLLHRRSHLLRFLMVLALLGFQASSVRAKEHIFGPFSFDDANPDVIQLDGDIDAGSALNFRRVLQAAPDAKIITLNSTGGSVHMGLLIADDIHRAKLATYVPMDSGCYSACAYLFLAGLERKADGKLGVHQISADEPDLVDAQFAISDIIDVLNRFDTPMEVMSIMFKTPPDEMHVFTTDEIEEYRLNRSASSEAETEDENSSLPETATDQVNPVSLPPAYTPPISDSPATAMASPTLPSLEEFTSQPNRIAIYVGLDFFGADIASRHEDDATACALSCLGLEGECKAFTFNVNPKITRGPNCFLKADTGRADGNSVALSGRLLTAAETDPKSIYLATIDPETALFDDIDLPGGDLYVTPKRTAQTQQQCRLACIDDDRCAAFTYVPTGRQCWLKGRISAPSIQKGLTSGIKTFNTFKPERILSLQ